jgi:hypothetical protein
VTLADRSFVIDTDVRHTMDSVMFPLHEQFCGRVPDIVALQQLEHYEDRYRWLDERVVAGESYTAYPVTFGTSYEVLWRDSQTAHRARRQMAELAYGIEQPGCDEYFLRPAESGHDHDWIFGENRAVLSIAEQKPRTSMDTYDAMRIQVLEYLTLQRAALRSVQRGTQLVITEQESVGRDRLQGWQRLVSALTDEYVLHDQVALILGPVRAHMTSNPRLRDPASLEAQVRQNLETFQALIDAASNRVAIVLSGLFGVVAALTLAPLAREIELAVFRTRGTASNYETVHPVLSIAIDAVLLFVVALVCVFLIGNANRLRRARR